MMHDNTSIVMTPEILEDLQRKLKEKFPDVELPKMQELLNSRMPITTSASTMRFKLPPHLIPNSSGYYGDFGGQKDKNKNKNKTEEGDEEETNVDSSTAPLENEMLFDFKNEEERKLSSIEVEYNDELVKIDSMTPDEK